MLFLCIAFCLVPFVWIFTLFLCDTGKVWKSVLHICQSKQQEKGRYASRPLVFFYIFYWQTIKDWMLFIIVALLTGIDVLLLIIETSTRSTRVETKIVPDTQQFEVTTLVRDEVYFIIIIIILQDGTLKNYYFFLCDHSGIFLAVKHGYRVLLQLVGIFFAFHTRKIKIKGLKESTQIGYIIYFNALFVIILLLSDYVIKYRHHHITVSVEAVISFIQATLFLVLFFVPNVKL